MQTLQEGKFVKKLTKREYSVLLTNQKNEINGYLIYIRLSNIIKNRNNSMILKRIADSEKYHYEILKKYSGIEVKPNILLVFTYVLVARILGLTFALKLMEKGEANSDNDYKLLKGKIPEVYKILKDEDIHEIKLLNMIRESHLDYVGSIVLGLNDALVEFTGALAGYTFAIQNNRIIAMIGLITGISASLSMASSEFLSKRNEGEKERALSASVYTGVAYIFTVFLLVLPFLLIKNHFIDLFISVAIAVLVILFFTFYISTVKGFSFKKRFLEMSFISIGVALVSFGIGFAVRKFMGVEI